MPLQATVSGRQRANRNTRSPTSAARLPTLSYLDESGDEGYANKQRSKLDGSQSGHFLRCCLRACLRQGGKADANLSRPAPA